VPRAMQIITNGVMTGTAAVVSTPLNMEDIDNVGLEVDWTGTAVGTFSLEASNKYDPDTNPSATFKAVTLATPPANPAGSASGWLLDLNQIPFRWVRLRYTNSSSTGVLNAYAFRRSIGN
jgi:hypothetical protein